MQSFIYDEKEFEDHLLIIWEPEVFFYELYNVLLLASVSDSRWVSQCQVWPVLINVCLLYLLLYHQQALDELYQYISKPNSSHLHVKYLYGGVMCLEFCILRCSLCYLTFWKSSNVMTVHYWMCVCPQTGDCYLVTKVTDYKAIPHLTLTEELTCRYVQ